MAGISLFTLPQVVQVVLPNNPAGEVMITSFHHTRSDFKVFWNVDNIIDFFRRDFDRKIKAVGSEQYAIIITNPKNGDVVAQSTLSVANAARGHLQYNISASASLQFPIGMLRYAIVRTVDGKTTLLYTDRDHGPQSTLEVKYGTIPAISPPTVITTSNFSNIDGGLRAGAFPGPATTGDLSALRTYLIKTTGFTGQIIFEASVSQNTPTNSSEWFVAETKSFSNVTATTTFNLEGNYAWIRLRLVPTTGTLDKISFR